MGYLGLRDASYSRILTLQWHHRSHRYYFQSIAKRQDSSV
jgi:hypothetical protein